MLFLKEIIPLAIPYHSTPIPMSMQSLKKIGKKVLKLEHGNEAQSIFDIHQGPLAIPYHSSSIPISMQCLKKIGQKVLKLEHGNKVLMDRWTDRWTITGWTDGHSKFGGYNIIPATFCVAGIKTIHVYENRAIIEHNHLSTTQYVLSTEIKNSKIG